MSCFVSKFIDKAVTGMAGQPSLVSWHTTISGKFVSNPLAGSFHSFSSLHIFRDNHRCVYLFWNNFIHLFELIVCFFVLMNCFPSTGKTATVMPSCCSTAVTDACRNYCQKVNEFSFLLFVFYFWFSNIFITPFIKEVDSGTVGFCNWCSSLRRSFLKNVTALS